MYSTSWGGIYLGHKGNGYIFSAIYLFIELIVCFYRVNNSTLELIKRFTYAYAGFFLETNSRI